MFKILNGFGQEVPLFMWWNKFYISPNSANWFNLVIVTMTFTIAQNKLSYDRKYYKSYNFLLQFNYKIVEIKTDLPSPANIEAHYPPNKFYVVSEFLWFCTIGIKTVQQINTTLFWSDPLLLKLCFSCNWSRIWKLFTNFKYPWLNFPSPTLNKFLSFYRSYKVLNPPTMTTEESPKK